MCSWHSFNFNFSKESFISLVVFGCWQFSFANISSSSNEYGILRTSMRITNIENYFERNDILIVDRGFRDCLEFLKQQHFIPSMPGYLPGSQKQHTDLEANLSRIITAIRWVVEAKNGQVKKFQYFNNVVLNTQLQYLEKDFKIICALLN